MRDCPYSLDSYFASIRQLHRSRLTAFTPLHRHFIGCNLPGLPATVLGHFVDNCTTLSNSNGSCICTGLPASCGISGHPLHLPAWYPYRRHWSSSSMSDRYRPRLTLLSVWSHSSPIFATAVLELLTDQTQPPSSKLWRANSVNPAAISCSRRTNSKRVASVRGCPLYVCYLFMDLRICMLHISPMLILCLASSPCAHDHLCPQI